MLAIGAKVGDWAKGAVNRATDVETVQALLKAAAEQQGRPDLDPGEIDGKIARNSPSQTVGAIVAFQKAQIGSADGVVDPGMKTITLLGAFEFLASAILKSLGEDAAKTLTRIVDWVGTANCCFPLDFVPSQNYAKGGLRFGAQRRSPADRTKPFVGYRKHAGCDLIAKAGTPIYAVADGEVITKLNPFLYDTKEFAVDHTRFVARYTEVRGWAEGVKLGGEVKKGQVIAYVGQLKKSAMLHFEMYDGTLHGNFTVKQKPTPTMKNAPFMRRADLVDPTPYLDRWKHNLPTRN